MIVHLMASAENVEKPTSSLRLIADIIQSEGHTLATDWTEKAYERAVRRTKLSRDDWRAIYKDNMAAIAKSDVFIAEATLRSFGTGYQIAISVRSKKPTLILRHEDAPNDMASGIEEEHVTFKTYNEQTLKDVVAAFLKENDISTKDLRFNFSIDRKIYNYLRWASLKTGETKAEILRKLVEREIDKTEQ